MLDSETKRRIDACRDILVGKVPDPKSQVEQITIALIYKFMDDMDAEAEELGGSRSFFAADYARFGWARLMAPGLGGFEVLALYSEAIQKMNENPGVPPLFRDIFKNAYLPYRDPETLKSFLKEINYFTYDHSERLGDAFEYLLSVLGSQGDAGQFRTPRHIIDFMVEVMDPKKNETILDPACGTAGFLISAWKHIIKSNSKLLITNDELHTSKDDGDEFVTRNSQFVIDLTPDERARIAASIFGYDISPDMVRLSLVNLYLHGFTNPRVQEYDTLTQDDKWNEVADVILANPPFMSPKGGIKPHKRFSVQASRSEVLFVDYMAEHLTATGRAAIVVPEGIIFQSGTAYKALRKMLVDTSLVAVVSLPAGVFNPYSGVKTSILILDKRVHKQTDQVLFVKVGNDGFNLGAQRRAVVNSDLPAALAAITNFKLRITNGGSIEEDDAAFAQPLCLIVPREKVRKSGNFNLSSDRYLVTAKSMSSHPMVTLGSVSGISDGDHQAPPKVNEGVPFVTISNIDQQNRLDFSKTFFVPHEYFDQISPKRRPKKGDCLYSVTGSFGITVFVDADKDFCFQRHISLIRPGPELFPKYLYFILSSDSALEQARKAATGIAQKTVSLGSLREFQIPLPPLEVQHQIVAEIEGYQEEITNLELRIKNCRDKIAAAVNKVWGVDED